MALFKIKKGVKANLPTSYVEGYCYFTTDDGKFYVDTSSAASGRICLNAGQADRLKTTSAGSASLPVYFSNGVPVACNSTLNVNISGNAATASALTTSAGSASRPVYFSSGKPTQITLTLPAAIITTGFDTAFRTSINGSTSISPFLGVVRTDTASVTYAPQYGSGIVWGEGDTHGYLYVGYSSQIAYLGGGNADKLNWVKQIAFTDSNVASATKLVTARTIDGVSFDGSANITHYGTCSTAASTAEKVVSCPGFNLVTGALITVKFDNTNTVANPTLNVNNTGAKPVYYRGNVIQYYTENRYLTSYTPVSFIYDGTKFELLGGVDNNTIDMAGLSDKKNTKLFIVGGLGQYSAGTTCTNSNVYIGTDNCLYSNNVKVATVNDLNAIDTVNSAISANYLQGLQPSKQSPASRITYIAGSFLKGTGSDQIQLDGTNATIETISAPTAGCWSNETKGTGNVQIVRFFWSSTHCWTELYMSPNYDGFWHGSVKNGVRSSWKRMWMQGDSITGAVWNDYAEYRESDCKEFGRVVFENGDDTLSKTTKRLQHFAGVTSDTWGFCQGETEKAKTPIAVAGRVLVYTYQDRNNYKSGDCVCAAPNGTVDIMTQKEITLYPDKIVGTVSCVPTYDTWGSGDRPPVDIDGRIWIKVK